MNIKQIEMQIQRHMAAIAKRRDELDDLIGTLTDLREDCGDAYDHLERARDSLSEMV